MMTEVLTHNLARLLAEYCRHTGRSEDWISRRTHGLNWFFKRLQKSPGGFTIRKYDEMVARFSHLWPADLAWPADIPRPPTAAGKVRAENRNSEYAA